jgi:hypothetical protein
VNSSVKDLKRQLAQQLSIRTESLDVVNLVLDNPDQKVIDDFLEVILKYGTPEEINHKVAQASQMEVLLEKVRKLQPEYLIDLNWLRTQRDAGAFITMSDYRRKVLGCKADKFNFLENQVVEL